jgi:ubiquinone/menaquinone biosynthesis C-methylase UbiE
MVGYKHHPENGIELVSNWLHAAPPEDSIYYLTPPRKYQHEETGYDEQYGIEHNDFTYGNGLCNLITSRKCDLSAPALEIGCGTGILTLGICQKNPFPLFIASDASPAFMRIVKKKLEQTENFTDKVRLAVIDGDALAHAPKQSFSLIVLKATLHHIIDPEQFITKTSELLVPDGMLVFHEPFWEGNVLLGMMAQTLMDKKYSRFSRKLWRRAIKEFTDMPNRYTRKVSQESHFAKLQLLIDTMKAASRRDIDKSTWEDKHLFKVSDIMKWGHAANLEVEFIANREFNEFADNANVEAFSYRKFIFTYISKCMNYGDQFARDFEADLGTLFDYLDQIAADNNSPEYHGIFIFRKRQIGSV